MEGSLGVPFTLIVFVFVIMLPCLLSWYARRFVKISIHSLHFLLYGFFFNSFVLIYCISKIKLFLTYLIKLYLKYHSFNKKFVFNIMFQ